MSLVLQIDKSDEGRGQLLAVRCRLLKQGGGGVVIFPAVDLAQATGTDGVGGRDTCQN